MEIVTSVVAKIGEYLVEPIGQQFGYLIFHKSYIKNVRDQFQRLGVERFELLLRVNAAKRNGEVIAPRVERWIQEVDNINEAVQRFLEKDVKAKRMVLKSHYILSRKAKENTLSIDKLLREGKFDIVSYPAPPLGIGPSSLSVEGFKGFESRIKLMKEVLEALRDDKINMIAICGMGGLGKTTMVQEVAKRVKADELFDEVVMAVVSQNQNFSNIQDEIVDSLGLKLDAASLPGRANQLFSRLENSKSVLVILDDIWEALDLKKVGIPYGNKYKKCKILLTTRFEDACKKMKTQNTSQNEILCEEGVCNEMKIQTFLMKLLSEEEAWNLFKEMVGNCINSPSIGPIAEEVAKECGRLPIAIVTVGSALADKSQVEWSAALQQLKRSISKNIPGLDSKVYSSIELSYNYLKSDEAKSCFLLCCLFPEDCDIPIEYLVRYGVGQRLFAKIDNVAEARNRVHAMVENLKRSFLLLDSKEEECVKMHDVVRDVAISIAEKRGFLVGCNDKMEEWPEQDTYERSAISLVSQELKKHPEGLECPKLELLQLACGKDTWQALPTNLFEGMIRLKVLSLIGMSFPSLPQSIHLLQNIRTLHIHDCEPTDVSAIGALRKLEILSLFGSNIVKLPREIGKLSYLKLLDLSECSNLLQIPPGLLSNLSRLKELYMLGVYVNWEPMEGNKEGANASLAELMSLSHRLTALKFHRPNIEVLPKDLLFKNQMIKFQIFVGEKGIYQELSGTGCYLFKNCLALEKTDTSDIVENRALIQLLEKSEILYLKQIKDLKNILYELDQEGFPCLKVLRVFASEDVEYIIDATSHQSLRSAFPILESLELSDLYNLKEIYHSQFPERSFSNAQLACFGNLKSLRLSECSRLKNVFSLSIARGLVQLQSFIIDWCDDMEEIFAKELEDEHALDKITFPRLTFIKLYSLQRLIGFCTVIGSIELVHPSMNQKAGRICSEEVPNFENHKMTDIQQHSTSSRKLFSSMTILWPPNLEDLELAYADSLEVVFDLEGLKLDHDRQRSTVFAQLKTLIVRNLYKLMYMWKNVPQGIQGFQNLTFIDVYECGRLKYLLPPSVAKLLVKLQSIEIRFCDAIQYIVQRDREEEVADTIVFPKLTSFTLRELPSLMSFCTEDFSFEWPSMKKIYLFSCPNLKTFGSEIRHPRKLKKISTGKLDSSLVRDSHGFLGQCFECVPCGGRYDPMVVSSNRGTTNKSQGMSSANKEGTLTTLKDPRFCDTMNSPAKMWSLFPSFLIECLKNLETICLWTCHSIEVIFQLEELNVEESHVASLLDQLRKLDLFLLPKLMHIWKKGSKRIMGFGNLRWLEVEKCNSLTYLFSPSIAKLLVMLEEIKVINCREIEEILGRTRKEEEEKDVLFCKVNSILLEDLPNLKCFCTEANAFEWPSLKKMRVLRCPNLKMFVPANLNTPQLEGVYEDFGFKKRQWKGDLNATIKHIFKGKEKQVDNETQQQEKSETSKKNA